MEEILKQLYLIEKKQTKEIAKELNITVDKTRYLLRKYKLEGKKGRNKSNVNEELLTEDYMPLWYYLGLIASDGYLKQHPSGHISIRLTIKNKGSLELLTKIAYYLGYTNKIRTYKNNFNELEIVNDKLLAIINYIGIPLKNKTFDINFPKDLTENQARMFIRGVFDGDGSVGTRTNTMQGGNFKLISASENFLNGVKLELEKWLKLELSIYKGKSVYEINANVKNSMLIFEWLYKDYPDLRLKYKYEKYIIRKEYKESDNYWSKNHNVLIIDTKTIFKDNDIV